MSAAEQQVLLSAQREHIFHEHMRLLSGSDSLESCARRHARRAAQQQQGTGSSPLARAHICMLSETQATWLGAFPLTWGERERWRQGVS